VTADSEITVFLDRWMREIINISMIFNHEVNGRLLPLNIPLIPPPSKARTMLSSAIIIFREILEIHDPGVVARRQARACGRLIDSAVALQVA